MAIDQYVVIGNPIEHSKSPRIHAAFAAQTQQDMQYDRLLAPLDDFAGAWQQFVAAGGRGANVTVPFKQDAFACCDERTARAELAGAVNTLVPLPGDRWLGDNTDGAGLVRDIIANACWTLAGQRILLLGAGGAAAGVIEPLLAEQPACLYVANRTEQKAEALIARFNAPELLKSISLGALASVDDIAPFDVIINATSASLQGNAIALSPSLLHTGTAAYDMMYGADTVFLAWARTHGISRCRDGLGMLVEQAAEAFWLWRGIRPATAELLSQLRTELTP